MKVLKEGNPNGWEIERTCTGEGNGDGGCGAVLLVAEDDIFATNDGLGYWDSKTYFTFKCPCCGVLTDIPSKDIVYRVQQKALDKYRAMTEQEKEKP